MDSNGKLCVDRLVFLRISYEKTWVFTFNFPLISRSIMSYGLLTQMV
jgi:hypothetical protein